MKGGEFEKAKEAATSLTILNDGNLLIFLVDPFYVRPDHGPAQK